jgi:glutathione S-transferase
LKNLQLYFWPGACSIAAHIVLEEIGLPFDAIKVDFASGKQREREYLAINSHGRVPALATSSGVLTENLAILRYLAVPENGVKAGSLWPSELDKEARCVEWCSWLASTVHVAYAHISRPERYSDSIEGKAEVIRKGVEACRPLWREIEERLQDREWALGDDYSVVDPYLQVFWNWGRGARLGYDMAHDFPVWTAHARRLAKRPAVQRAFAREGLLLPE